MDALDATNVPEDREDEDGKGHSRVVEHVGSNAQETSEAGTEVHKPPVDAALIRLTPDTRSTGLEVTKNYAAPAQEQRTRVMADASEALRRGSALKTFGAFRGYANSIGLDPTEIQTVWHQHHPEEKAALEAEILVLINDPTYPRAEFTAWCAATKMPFRQRDNVWCQLEEYRKQLCAYGRGVRRSLDDESRAKFHHKLIAEGLSRIMVEYLWMRSVEWEAKRHMPVAPAESKLEAGETYPGKVKAATKEEATLTGKPGLPARELKRLSAKEREIVKEQERLDESREELFQYLRKRRGPIARGRPELRAWKNKGLEQSDIDKAWARYVEWYKSAASSFTVYPIIGPLHRSLNVQRSLMRSDSPRKRTWVRKPSPLKLEDDEKPKLRKRFSFEENHRGARGMKSTRQTMGLRKTSKEMTSNEPKAKVRVAPGTPKRPVREGLNLPKEAQDLIDSMQRFRDLLKSPGRLAEWLRSNVEIP